MRRPRRTRWICALVIGLVWTIVTAPATAEPIFVTGAGPGGGPHVQVFDGRTGKLLFGFFAYDPRFTGGVRVSAADVNGDGVADVITAPGPGGGPHIRVFDGAALQAGQVVDVVGLFAYDPAFTGGVYIAAASPPPAPLWAVVAADGTLLRGSRALAARNFPPNTGLYRVDFDRNVLNCAHFATLGREFGRLTPGHVSSHFLGGVTTSVVIETWNAEGTSENRGFNLVLHC